MYNKLYDLPSRDDIKYIEIENFKDYEFSSCLAYELAIRNEKVKEELECFSNHYKNEHTSYIQQLLEQGSHLNSDIEKDYDFTILNEYGFNEDSIAYYY
jgi:guanylate kinase